MKLPVGTWDAPATLAFVQVAFPNLDWRNAGPPPGEDDVQVFYLETQPPFEPGIPVARVLRTSSGAVLEVYGWTWGGNGAGQLRRGRYAAKTLTFYTLNAARAEAEAILRAGWEARTTTEDTI